MSKSFPSDCPFCKNKMIGFRLQSYHSMRDRGEFCLFGVCNNCSQPSVHYFGTMVSFDSVDRWLGNNINTGFHDTCKPVPLMIAPEFPTSNVPEHLPDMVHAEFVEAEECFSGVNTKRSAVRAYRAAIEAALKDKGAVGYNILKKIDSLFGQGILTVTLKDFAHTVRIIGNDAAHGDNITEEEARDVRTFSTQLMTYLYTLPAQIPDRVKEKMPD